MQTQSIGAPAPLVPSVFTAQESRTIQKALSLIESKRLRNQEIFHYFEDFERYLVLRFAGLLVEEFHVLYLDSSRRLLAADSAAVGDQKSVAPNFRHVAFRAISLGADSVVLAHNHPNDSATPSDADLNQLQWAEKALGWLNIALLDSYVVTSKRIASIRKFRERADEMATKQRWEEMERRSAERKAKMAATKAAKRAAQLQGVAA